MFGSTVIDVAIGMIFIYLLLSLICSAINEIIEAWLKKRATDLERGLRELLHDRAGDVWVKKLYDHPLIGGLYRGVYETSHIIGDRYRVKGLVKYAAHANLPSYIPARNFALALRDLVASIEAAPSEDAAADNAALNEEERQKKTRKEESINEVRRAVEALTRSAGADPEKALKNVEDWFNSSMDRVSGLYKRRTQVILLGLGLGLTLFVNADTIAISRSLANDPALRQSLVTASQEYAKTTPAPSPSPDPTSPYESCKKNANSPECRVSKNIGQLKEFGLPIGWDRANEKVVPRDFPSWALKFLGWLVTAAAISLGAPFWFDLLNKFMIVRSTVKPHEKSPEEPSIG